MLPNFRQTCSSQIELSKPFAAKATSENLVARFGLTKKAEPPPTRGVNRDSGTDSANGGWLRRLVRHHGHRKGLSYKIIKAKAHPISAISLLVAGALLLKLNIIL
jgi:hypothetical protein